MPEYKSIRQVKRFINEELRTACKKYIGEYTNTDTIKKQLQRICNEGYMHRRCPIWFKVRVKPVACTHRVNIELEPIEWEGIPFKDGEE